MVEKILADRERLPKFAGVHGTTGYEWLNVISRLLAGDGGLARLDRVWHEASGDGRPFDEVLIAAKRRVITTILASEFTVLARLLARLAAGHYSTRDFAADRLRAALELFILHFPIYRTYLTGGPSAEDRAIINRAIDQARADWFGPDAGVFDFLRDALTLDLTAGKTGGHSLARNRRFAFKVQQFTGPMMAKSLEDTAFYRYHRMLALNEVGGEPAASALSVAQFHDRMVERQAKWPHGMTATATHDTKRGEDARTRLLALCEMPDEWATACRRVAAARTKRLVETDGRNAPADAGARIHALSGACSAPGRSMARIETLPSASKPMRSRRRARARNRRAGSRRTRRMRRRSRCSFGARSTGAIEGLNRFVFSLRAPRGADRGVQEPDAVDPEGNDAGRARLLSGHRIVGPLAGRSGQSPPGGFRPPAGVVARTGEA